MQFFTKVPLATVHNPINYRSNIVAMGSCFVENIGAKLDYFKFQHTSNPFGIIFNPKSVEKIIQRSVRKDFYTEKQLFFHNERWHCFEIHSDLSHSDKEYMLQMLNDNLISLYNQLSTASHFVLTLGTAWVYKFIESQEIAANCHKIPQKNFSKHLLTTAEITKSLENIAALIGSLNSKCHFIYTISPVRHLKDGFVENQVSKSNLISAVYELVREPQNKNNLSYFPSYEIMMDELRDYRFYNGDLIHPNATAIDYIWSRFVETYIEKSSYPTMEQVQTIQKALQHKPFDAASHLHQKFLRNLHEKVEQIQTEFPHMQF
jgi:hypothetical protein